MKYLRHHLRPERKQYKQAKLYYSKEWRSFRQYYLSVQGGLCVQCKRTMADKHLHLDHIIPLFKGGAAYDEDNIQVLCVSCHGKKTIKETIQRPGVGSKSDKKA